MIFFVASTPVIPGMLRSMTTTSGCNSRTSRSASSPAAATTSTPSSSSRFRNPVRNRSWSSTNSTRGLTWSGVVVVSMDSVTSIPSPPGGRRKQRSLLGARPVLVQRDGDRSPAPVRRGGRGREPKIDHCALNRPAGIRGDALAITGNRHLGPERDDARINGDDAVADRCAGGGVALQRVGSRGYRQRRLAGGGGCCLRWYRYRRRGLRGHALDGNATSLGRDRLCLRIGSA